MFLEYSDKDLEDCINLFYNTFTTSPWNYDWLTKEKSRTYLIDMINTPKFLGYIYRDESSELLGFCFGCYNDCFLMTTYEIKEILVKTYKQGSGLGSKILSLVENSLQNLNISYVTLATQKNIPAFNFYMKNSYEVSENAVYLSKSIK